MTHKNNLPASGGVVARFGIWASQHRARVVVAWVMLLIVLTALSHAVGTRYINSLSLGGTDSKRASDLLTRSFPAQAGDTDQVVFNARYGSITDATARARVALALSRVATLPHVTRVISPYSAAGARAISADRHVAFATVTFDERANDLPVGAVKLVISIAEQARSPRLEVELGGPAIEHTQPPTLGAATAIGLLAAVIILFVTFGSLVAAGMPIVTALLGLGTAFGLAGLSSQLVDTPDFSTQLAALIGLGVGIDYALFIVTRFRDNYRDGATVQAAIAGAMDTAGRSVLFAGSTVIIALLGLFALGVSLLYGVAVSAALAVLLTMLAALTILPVLLSRFGERIGRSRRAASSPGSRGAHGRFWPRWTAFVQRHPWGSLSAGLLIMLTLAAPSVALRLGASDAGNDPGTTTTRQAYDLLSRGFGRGFNGPLLVVAQLPHAQNSTALVRIADRLRTSPDVASVSPPRISRSGSTAVFSVYPGSAPQSQATADLVQNLRNNLLPTIARSTGTRLLVGGEEATSIDFTHVLADKLPLFIGIILALVHGKKKKVCTTVKATPKATATPTPVPKYTLVDVGTLGGPNAWFASPGQVITSDGTVLTSADIKVADPDYQNIDPVFNPPDPNIQHAALWRKGVLTDLGALSGNNASGIFVLNASGEGAGMSENGKTDPVTKYSEIHAVVWKDGQIIDLGTLGGSESAASWINDQGQVVGFATNAVQHSNASSLDTWPPTAPS
jgi:putative drug exporter of the RND superfamily